MNKTLLAEANEVAAWLKDYAVNANRKALVVGVSGGVDSALVSTLCAMTGLPTHVVMLPCRSKPDGLDKSDKHIDWLMDKFPNVSFHELDLTATFNAFERVTKVGYENDLAYANAKSRLRMIALYQIATVVGGLVVGTGNKVEDFGVGFFTKYGDGGVDLSPIADFLKSEVREMCRQLGILPELCEAVPTDGLWADTRTDESQLGATYDELEWAMKFLDTTCHTTCLSEVFNDLTPRQKEVIEIYTRWHKAGAHKLAPIPTFKRS